MVADIPTNRRQSKNLGDLVYTLPPLIRTLKSEKKLLLQGAYKIYKILYKTFIF